ncbi:hypothetical protein CVT25_000315 [Psilocybe cyanescens]|uniref:Nephrocystin 3-like N-terminal domain-containing protein n=1 Tax=Psilocybe cyanescens TaxID=93625 RepID=A0A409XET6_PSICY|nr:hypothetical protein CVT25_000315 [Psilocybe cyanescens]
MPDEKKNSWRSKAAKLPAKLRGKVLNRIGSPRSGLPFPGNAQVTTQSAGGSTFGSSTPILTTSPHLLGQNVVTQSTLSSISVASHTSAVPLTSAAPPASAQVPTPIAPATSKTGAHSFGSGPFLSDKAKEHVKTTLKGAYVLLKVLKESSDAFPPLKAAVGCFIACVDTYQKTSSNYDEMTQVLDTIDQLMSVIAARVSEFKDHKPLEQMVERLTRSLGKEIEKIETMQEPGLLSRIATSSDDAGKLISSYQAISNALNRLQVDLGLQVERNTRHILTHVVFEKLPLSNDAAFDAAINVNNASRGPCTKGTRIAIIDQIMEWAKETDPIKAPSVYWLSGLGGLGKTTIAYTVCQQLEDDGIPFSSFFCSQQLDSKDSKLLIPTLCRDLAELFSSFAAEVLDVLETNSKIVNAVLRRQMDKLFAEPWQASIACRVGLPAPVVVVDALDENDRGTDFLKELFRVVQLGKLKGIKFLVTSRPEPELVELFKELPENAVYKLHEVNVSNVQEDIRKYLCKALPGLKSVFVKKLADQASGFFIYAATVVRFLEPFSTSQKDEQLQKLLSEWPKTIQAGDKLPLDELYENVLKVAFWNEHVRAENLQILHTVLCAESRVDMSVIAALSNAQGDTVQKVIKTLYAVLYLSTDNHCVYWYHTSFRDFIFDQNRAMLKFYITPNGQPSEEIKINVFCNPSTHHTFLAHQCFSIMEVLCFNICKLESSYQFDSEVADLHTRLENNIPLKLQYASWNWAKHLVQAKGTTKIVHDLVICLEKFMCNKLLFWIEAMNLIGARVECSSLLKNAENWLEKVRNILQAKTNKSENSFRKTNTQT